MMAEKKKEYIEERLEKQRNNKVKIIIIKRGALEKRKTSMCVIAERQNIKRMSKRRVKETKKGE